MACVTISLIIMTFTFVILYHTVSSEINLISGCPHNKSHKGDRSVHNNLSPSLKLKCPISKPRLSPRSESTLEEREERINRGFARIMQLMTFLGHVDNYLTDKAGGLIKIMGRAIETTEEEVDLQENNRIYRRSPKIRTTNIS